MAIARCDLHFTDDSYLRLTPIEFQAVQDRHAQANEREEILFGIIASAVANFSYWPPKKPLSPNDFGLGPKRKKKIKVTDPRSNAEQIFDNCNAWRAFGKVAPLPLIKPEVLNAE